MMPKGWQRVALALFLVCATCGEGTGSAADSPPINASPPAKDASKITCAEWGTDLDSSERREAAAELLQRGRSSDGLGTPSGFLVSSFVADVTAACPAAPSQTLQEVAAALYVIGHDTYGT